MRLTIPAYFGIKFLKMFLRPDDLIENGIRNRHKN